MMSLLSLMKRNIRYNISAHLSNYPNLIAGTLGMITNNTIFLLGMWGMLFAGKPENEHLLYYYIALNALVMIAWGGINFFCGGWMDLGDLIVSGQFESKLATPRHPLVLVSTHALHPSSMGDLLMGLFGVGVLFATGNEGMGIRTLLASTLATVGFFSLYVFSGSLAFFIPRGNVVALLVREMVISLSAYPMGKIYPSGIGRVLLLMTPAAAVTLLPMDWVESAGFVDLVFAVGAVLVLLVFSLSVYSAGVKRFQAINLIGAQN
jgi:ABC-type uncharacterized transport system permease subunit